MFFFFSKLVHIVIDPANWLVILLILLLLLKNNSARKWISIALFSVIMLFGNRFIYNKLVLTWQPVQENLEENENYSAGILLGGIASFDKEGQGYLGAATDRLTETAILYHSNKIAKIIITGGAVYSDRPPEAPFLAATLFRLNIPQHDILVESRSRTTFENAIFSKQMIDSLQLQPPFLLITSALHLKRAVATFEKAGVKVIGYPTDFRVINRKFDIHEYIVPDLQTINDWGAFANEIVGFLGYKIFGKA